MRMSQNGRLHAFGIIPVSGHQGAFATRWQSEIGTSGNEPQSRTVIPQTKTPTGEGWRSAFYCKLRIIHGENSRKRHSNIYAGLPCAAFHGGTNEVINPDTWLPIFSYAGVNKIVNTNKALGIVYRRSPISALFRIDRKPHASHFADLQINAASQDCWHK